MSHHSQYVQDFLDECPNRFRRAWNTLELCLDKKTITIENLHGILSSIQEFSDTYDLGITISNIDLMLARGREERVEIEFDTQIIESKLNSITRLRVQRNGYKARSQDLGRLVEQLKARVNELENENENLKMKIKVSDPEITNTSSTKIQVSDPETDTKNPAKIQVADLETDNNNAAAETQVFDPELDHDAANANNTATVQASDPNTSHAAETMVSNHDYDEGEQKPNDEGFDSEEPDLTPLEASKDEQEGDEDEYIPPTPPSGSPKIFRPSGKTIFGSVAMPAAFRQLSTGFGSTFGTTAHEMVTSSSRTKSAFGAISYSGSGNHASSAFGGTSGLGLFLGVGRGLWSDNWGEVEFTTLPASDDEDDGEPAAKKQKLLRVK